MISATSKTSTSGSDRHQLFSRDLSSSYGGFTRYSGFSGRHSYHVVGNKKINIHHDKLLWKIQEMHHHQKTKTTLKVVKAVTVKTRVTLTARLRIVLWTCRCKQLAQRCLEAPTSSKLSYSCLTLSRLIKTTVHKLLGSYRTNNQASNRAQTPQMCSKAKVVQVCLVVHITTIPLIKEVQTSV